METHSTSQVEALLADDGWMRRIARSLVRDSNTADELVQEAYLAALEGPPPLGISLRAWAAATMRNLMRSDLRSADARAARERDHSRADAPVEPADRSLHQIETQRLLIEAVQGLDEPYRSAILARYVEDISVAEFARRTGAPVKTVQSQVARGLERLRERLDREHRGEREAWILGLTPLLGPPRAGQASTLKAVVRKSTWIAAAAAVLVLVVLVCGWIVELNQATNTPVDIALDLNSAKTRRADPDTRSLGGISPRQAIRAGKTELVEVMVVQGAPATPVPHATLTWWPLPDGDDPERQIHEWFREGTLEDHTAVGAETHYTNADGLAELPRGVNGFLVTASFATLWGMGIATARHEGPMSVGIRPDNDVEAQVLGVDRLPLSGIRVQLQSTGYCGDEENDEYLYATTTAPGGLATLRHVGYVKHDPSSPCKATSELKACVVGLSYEPTATLAANPTVGHRASLSIAVPVGFCELQLVAPGMGPSSEPFCLYADSCSTLSGISLRAPSGQATIAAALNTPVYLNLGWSSDDRIALEGLRQPCEVVHVDLPSAGPSTREVTGVLVSANGHPIANEAVELRSSREAYSTFTHGSHVYTRTDATGSFTAHLAPDTLTPYAEWCTISVSTLGADHQPTATANRRVGTADPKTDLGRLGLSPIAVLITGTVYDDLGRPLADANISTLASVVGADRLAGYEKATQSTSSDKSGRFWIRGASDESLRMFLRARKGGFGAAVVEVAPDNHHVDMVLFPSGSIGGEAFLDPAIVEDGLYVQATREDGPTPSGIDSGEASAVYTDFGVGRAVLGPNGEFELNDLTPGSYSLTLRRHRSDEREDTDLAVIDGVRVSTGNRTRDPRLCPLDLRSNLRYVTITVVEEDEAPVPHAIVYVDWPSHLVTPQVWECDNDGRVQVLTSPEGHQVEVWGLDKHDFLPLSTNLGVSDATVVLVRAPLLHFQIGSQLPALSDGMELTLRLTQGERGSWEPPSGQAFDSEGRLQSRCSLVGEVSVSLQLCSVEARERNSGVVMVQVGAEQRFTIKPRMEQAIAIGAPDQAALRDAVRALAEQR